MKEETSVRILGYLAIAASLAACISELIALSTGMAIFVFIQPILFFWVTIPIALGIIISSIMGR